MPDNTNPFVTSFARLWLLEGRARPDHVPEFLNFLKMGAIDKNFGSVNPIFQPDPHQFDNFIQVGSFRDEEERVTTSMVGQYAADVKSRMLQLAQAKCQFDIQLHIGQCTDPSIYSAFQKLIIFEGVLTESYGTDDIGSLEPGERSKVDETGEISAIKFYEFVPLVFASRAPSEVTNELVDITHCDSPSCGDCTDESDGCQKFVAISLAAGGSPTTPADIVYTLDKGQNWISHDIDTLPVADDPSAVACVGSYVVVVSADDVAQHITLRSNLKTGIDPDFTRVATGYAGGPNAISSVGNKAFVVGNSGYVYTITDPTAGVNVIDASVATISDLTAVDGLSSDFAVVVGIDGVILVINNDLVSLLATSPIGLGTDFTSVAVKSKTEWFVGDNAGVLRYTNDGGATWTQKVLPNQATITAITDIDISTNSVMYVSATVAGKGEIYISTSGGQEFVRGPRDTNNTLPNNDRINAIAICPDDPDYVVGVGLHSDGTDGFIVVGNDG